MRDFNPAYVADGVKPGLPPWGPHVRFRRVQTLVWEGSPLVKLRFIGRGAGAPCWAPPIGDTTRWQ